MVLARWQATITGDNGDIVPGASVEVRNEATGSLATLYSDRAGAVGISNPMTADSDGFAYFHVDGGAYKITATSSGLTREWRYVPIGTAGEGDKEEILITSATLSNTADVIYGGLANYEEIKIEVDRLIPVTDGEDLALLVSIDGGVSYLAGTNYLFTLDRTTTSSAALSGSTGNSYFLLGADLGNDIGEFFKGTISIKNHNDASIYKSIEVKGTMYDSAAAQRVVDGHCVVKTLGLITNVAMVMTSGNFGIKTRYKGVPI